MAWPRDNNTHCGDKPSIWFMSFYPSHRLRLIDGGYVYMTWHSCCGPTFYKDREGARGIDEWYENPSICKALDWFINRGFKA